MALKYKQDNDLTVLLEPLNDVVSLSVGLWINTGSRDEMEEEYGYAHFIEHMLFKGTKNLSAKDIAREIDRIGGQHNAATNREYTCYYINVVSDYLELAIKILADMYANSLFEDTEIEKEKNVIIEEIRMYEDTPDEFIHDIFIENMLKGHPLSHSILGTIEGINKITRDKLLDFHGKFYKENNAIFVIAGKFEESEARSLISKYFNKNDVGIKQKSNNNRSPERIYCNHIERDLEQVHFCLGTEGIRRDDKNKWALYSLSTILGGNMSSRLFQRVREEEGICYSIYSFHSSYSDNGVFGIYCATSPDNFSLAVELIVEECRNILKNGVNRAELEDSKTFMKGNLALSYESTEVRMGQLAKNEITYGEIIPFDKMVTDLNNITLDDFTSITDTIFNKKRLSIVSVGSLNGLDIREMDLQL